MSDWSDWSDEEWVMDEEEAPKLTRGISYVIMDEKELKLKQMNAIKHISESLGLNSGQAAKLLKDNNWDTQQAIEKFIEGASDDIIQLTRQQSSLDPYLEYTCDLCCVTQKGKNFVGLECRHMYCRTCYTGFIEASIQQGSECTYMTCPMYDCSIIISEEVIKQLASSQMYKKYQFFLLRGYVDANAMVKWCPAPDCMYAVHYPKVKARTITCKCGHSWCFQCSLEAHQPLDCKKIQKWNELFQGKGDQNNIWILANTKKCPQCQSPIEKNEGCMHMTCKQCTHEFCWLCLGNWSEHGTSTGGFYSCNIYQDKLKKGEYREEEAKKDMAMKSIQRFNHYSDRFIDHKNSIQFALKKKQKFQNQVNEIMKLSYRVNPEDLAFLDQVLDQIIESRRMLAYSYPLGYFITSTVKVSFYEFIQGELERTLEMLDKQTDIDLDLYFKANAYMNLTNEFYSKRVQILDLANVVYEHFTRCSEQMEAGFPEIREQTHADSYLSSLINTAMRNLLPQIDEIDDPYDQHWMCGVCTFANDLNTNVCAICEAPRVA